MLIKINIFSWLSFAFSEFIKSESLKPLYEVREIFDCPHEGCKRVIIRLCGRHVVDKKVIDVVADMNMLEGFDKKTVRTLTYIAAIESNHPNYSIIKQKMSEEVDDYILEIKEKKNNLVVKKRPWEISPEMINQLSPGDANLIGYLKGIRETLKEFNAKRKILTLE